MRAFLGLIIGGIVGFLVPPLLVALNTMDQSGQISDGAAALTGIGAIILAMFGAIAGAIVGGFFGRKG